MLDPSTIDTIARAYDAAEKGRHRIRPPSVQYEGFRVEDAYAVQRRWVEIKVAAGNPVRGHKIGLTSRAMQRQANITEPDYGALMADMFYADGAEIPVDRFIQPRVGTARQLKGDADIGHHAMHHGQAEPRVGRIMPATVDPLGGIERLERLLAHVLGHPTAGIGKMHHGFGALR